MTIPMLLVNYMGQIKFSFKTMQQQIENVKDVEDIERIKKLKNPFQKLNM